jgi:hypothetical protein
MEDHVINKSQLIALYNQYERKQAVYPNMEREVTPEVVRHTASSASSEGMIIYSQLTEANADSVIRDQVNYFERIGQNFEWKVYDYDQPADLKERLAAVGFTVEAAEALMVLDMEDAPSVLWQPVRHELRRITDPAQLVDAQTIEEQVWNEDSSWVVDYLGHALRHSPDQMSVYIAYVDEQPASAAWIRFPKNSPFASLWGGSTISRYRKQGLYTALLAIRAQEAKARQVRYLTVDASPMSRPILEKFGFEMIAQSYPCKWEFTPQN